jgi:hypothetical protein
MGYIYCPPHADASCPSTNVCKRDTPWFSESSKRCHHAQASDKRYLFCPPSGPAAAAAAAPVAITPALNTDPACPSASACADASKPWYSPSSRKCHHAQHSQSYIFCPAGGTKLAQRPAAPPAHFALPVRHAACPADSCARADVPWYSPNSKHCHHSKRSDYYIYCPPADAVASGAALSQRADACPAASCSDPKTPWYSPRSTHCHHAKHSDYYLYCPATPSMPSAAPPAALVRDAACPSGQCPSETPWYSPNSDKCHHAKKQDYYLYCAPAGATAAAPALPTVRERAREYL